MGETFKNKIVLITGASRGIGYQTALAFAKQGAHIIALARTVGGLEDLDDEIKALKNGADTTLVPCDLTDFEAIDRLGQALYERFGHLDVLIGNAGALGSIAPVNHLTIKDMDALFNLNVMANWRLIRSLDPLLRQSDAGRVIITTSSAADKTKPFWGGYSATKAALNTLVLTYAHENEHTKMRINLLNPGPVRTAMRAKAVPGEDQETLPAPSQITPYFLKLASESLKENGKIFDVKKKSFRA